MASTWRNLLPRDPLTALTLLALVPRVLAAFFSGGYFAHDDHFLVIEAAGSWADGSDYNNWLPWHQEGEPRPSGHSFFYVGFHYLLLVLLKGIGITHPKVMMVFVRLVHAVWSLIVVRTGYRIALKLSGDEEIAWRTGLLLALFYFMPLVGRAVGKDHAPLAIGAPVLELASIDRSIRVARGAGAGDLAMRPVARIFEPVGQPIGPLPVL